MKVSPFLAFRKHLTFLGFTWKSHFSVFFLKISLFLDFLEHLTFLGFTWKSHIFMSYLKISPFLENLVFEQSPAGRESDLKTEYIVICKNVDSFPCLLLLNDSKLLKFWLLTYLCLIRHSHCIPIQPLSCTNSVQHGITWNKNFFIIRNLISAIVALRHPPNVWEVGKNRWKKIHVSSLVSRQGPVSSSVDRPSCLPTHARRTEVKLFHTAKCIFRKCAPRSNLVSGIVVFQFRVG